MVVGVADGACLQRVLGGGKASVFTIAGVLKLHKSVTDCRER